MILKSSFVFLVLLCGCDSSSPLFERESKSTGTELSKISNKEKKPKEGFHGFAQDLNKSYQKVKGRLIHAIPLKEYNEFEPNFDIE